jgi:hypothetical protein
MKRTPKRPAMQMNGEYERKKTDRGRNHPVAVFPKKITHHLREPLTIRSRPIGSREARIVTGDQRSRNEKQEGRNDQRQSESMKSASHRVIATDHMKRC